MGFKINRIKADLGSYPHYMLLGIRKIGKTTFVRDLIKEKYGDATKGLLISEQNHGYRFPHRIPD